MSTRLPDCVLAFDPGREKCGVAIVCRDGVLRNRGVVPVAEVEAVVTEWAVAEGVDTIVLGDSTTSRQWQEKIATWLPQMSIVVVDERGSTLEARALYWQVLPPRGWRRVVPLSLQTPPEPVDDFAAVVLARRFFASLSDDTPTPHT
jgi:RNase H-fold protein (predicted Holliday junction resolvase)